MLDNSEVRQLEDLCERVTEQTLSAAFKRFESEIPTYQDMYDDTQSIIKDVLTEIIADKLDEYLDDRLEKFQTAMTDWMDQHAE